MRGAEQPSQPGVDTLAAGPLHRLRSVYAEYPSQFWVLLLGLFIDRLGGAMVFPFLTLYVTNRFGVGMTELGLLVALFFVMDLVGSTLGGALADRAGRKATLILGLVVSALSSLLMGWADSLRLLAGSLVVVGALSSIGGPAAQAMVADLLPDEKRAQGFGLVRVVANLAVAIGPAIGGLLAVRSYLYLFIGDAVASTITAALVLAVLQETLPASAPGAERKNILQTLHGYGRVVRDRPFVAFSAATILMVIVALQMNLTLPVFLRDVHGVSARQNGFILTLNASMVVLFQFYETRRIRGRAPLLMMALGSALYGLGYALYGFVSSYVLFLGAIAVATVGEMIVAPTGQALAAQMSPEDMRGRYMAAYGYSWIIPGIVGPVLIGWIMDNLDPRVTWYVLGLIGLSAAAAFTGLHRAIGGSLATSRSPQTQPGEAPAVPPQS